MPYPAAAVAGRRPPAFVADGDDLEDSDEETVEEAFDDEEEEEEIDGGKPPQRQMPWMVVAAAEASKEEEDSPLFASSTRVPNLNGGSGAVRSAAAGEEEEGGFVLRRKRRRRTGAAGSAEGRRKPLGALEEDSRRLFQRLWTDDDEIAILQGFRDFSSGRGAHHHHHHDTGPFYDQIRARLRLDFNKSQLVEKLRRLKKKYRNVTGKMGSTGKMDYAFRSPHDQATFELSRQIWGSSAIIYSRGGVGGGDDDDVDDLAPHRAGDLQSGGVVTVSEPRKPGRRSRKRSLAEATPAAGPVVLGPGSAPVEVKIPESHTSPKAMVPVPNVVQETVRSCLSPMFKDLLCWAVGGRMGGAGGIPEGLALSLLPLGVGSNQVKLEGAGMADEKWRKQQILELEVFSKRMELVQEQIKVALRELRSAG